MAETEEIALDAVSFWRRVERDESGCWIWRGHRNASGGEFYVAAIRRRRLAHRVAWMLDRNADPGTSIVYHLCDNPFCVRPSHLAIRKGEEAIALFRVRFWQKVAVRGPEECWPWQASRVPGWHGRVFSETRRTWTMAHRAAWELARGPIPPGQLVCHRCDNPICCNPAHLFLGTTQDNVDDRVRKGRSATGARNGQHLRRVRATAEQLRGKRRVSIARLNRLPGAEVYIATGPAWVICPGVTLGPVRVAGEQGDGAWLVRWDSRPYVLWDTAEQCLSTIARRVRRRLASGATR